MEEEKQEQAQPEQEVKEDDMIAKANAAAERLEKANEQLNKLLKQQASIIARDTLGGRSSASEPTKTKEDKEIEEARKMLKGTGYEDLDLSEK